MGKFSNTAEFIAKAKVVHGNDRFQYHAVEYRSAITNVTIHCPEHGPFQQTPNSHLTGSGCARCSWVRVSKANTHDTAYFIAKAKEVHLDKYRYEQAHYRQTKHLITITCPIHGPFQQYPINHLKGHGCAKCGVKVTSSKKLKGLEYFLTQAKALFGARYDYSKVQLCKLSEPITIICPIHGDFLKLPNAHLRGQGCQKCSARVHRAASRSGWMEVQKGRTALLYVIEIRNEQERFFKVGITFDLRKRFHSTRMPYAWRVVARLASDDATFIYSFEKHVHRQLVKFRYRPKVAFGGHMECYALLGPIFKLLPKDAMVESEWIEKKEMISSSFQQLDLVMPTSSNFVAE
ncbi:GIY-YIG nuclease family protein [Hymenobacter arizonensis]|uniref:T5orf172 domain-containing protein n=1 Tax=Hymenobacter arizonensis TaxID=1227077 RepID=A0A1I5YY87_HYMAR|nr:GIY-YIG nuclease family protein [Hymenobacter arizonensis]SFQ49174.1 T5orf172 domain-containing protein [Hymenobacter arizonensis]